MNRKDCEIIIASPLWGRNVKSIDVCPPPHLPLEHSFLWRTANPPLSPLSKGGGMGRRHTKSGFAQRPGLVLRQGSNDGWHGQAKRRHVVANTCRRPIRLGLGMAPNPKFRPCRSTSTTTLLFGHRHTCRSLSFTPIACNRRMVRLRWVRRAAVLRCCVKRNCAAMGEAGYRLATTRFAITRFRGDLLGLYDGLLRENRLRRQYAGMARAAIF